MTTATEPKDVRDMTRREYAAHKKEVLRAPTAEQIRQQREHADQAALQTHQPTTPTGGTK